MKSDAPQYSPDGLIGLSVLHSDWAHSIFYFEDANYEAVYERLLKKLIPSLKRFAVACTGGKAVSRGVAKRSKEAALPCIVIVDKDYDDLLGDFKKNDELGMLYLRRYSLENYLVEVDALIEIAVEALAAGRESQHHEIQEKVSDRVKYVEQLQQQLKDVARWFVFVRKRGLQIQTSKIADDVIFAGASPEFPLPEEWFQGYREQVIECVKSGPDWMLEGDHIEQGLSAAFETDCRPWGDLSPLDHVVGKHLLFGLLAYLDGRLGTSLCAMKSQELYIRVLNHVSLEPLRYLTDEIAARLHDTPALNV
jgi:tRNA pseudouridine-54 N-methylase